MPAQVGMDEVRKLPGIGLRRDLRHLDLGMEQQQPQQLAPGVAGRADNSDLH